MADGLTATPPVTFGIFSGIDVLSGIPIIQSVDCDYSSNGRFGLTLQRKYAGTPSNYSDNTNGRTMLGLGWLLNFEVRLEWVNDTYTGYNDPALRKENGALIQFKKIGSAWRADPAIMAGTLERTNVGQWDGGEIWKLTIADGDAVYGFDGYGYLLYMKDRNDNQLALTYGQGSGAKKLLTRVSASAPDDRYLDFEYYSPTLSTDLKTSRLKKVTPSWNGRFVEYTYHSTSGKLELVKDKWGRTFHKYTNDTPSWHLKWDLDYLESPDTWFSVQRPNANGDLQTIVAYQCNGGNPTQVYAKYDGAGTRIAWRYDVNTWCDAKGEAIALSNVGYAHYMIPTDIVFYDFSRPGTLDDKFVRKYWQELQTSPITQAINSTRIPTRIKLGISQDTILRDYAYPPFNNSSAYDYKSTHVTKETKLGEPDTHYFYDSMGRKTGEWRADDRWTSYTYDLKGNLRTARLSDNSVTTYTVDAYGRLASMQNGTGVVEYAHDGRSNIVWMKDMEGRYQFNVYDTRGLLTSTGRGETGTTVTYEYDSYDRLTTTTDYLGHQEVTVYDSIDQTVGSINPLGRQITYAYSPTTFTLTSKTNPANGVVSFEYDIFGNTTKVTDERGKSTASAYDYKGRLKEETNPLLDSQSWTYDDSAGCSSCGDVVAGNVKAVTSFSGQEKVYTRDDAGRLTEIEWTGTSDKLEIAYDKWGRPTTATDTRLINADLGGQDYVYEYDLQDRLTKIIYPDGAAVQYGYDTHGRRSWMKDPDLNLTQYTYNNTSSNKQLSLVDHSLLGVASYNYRSSDGLIDNISYSNMTEDRYSYDVLKRLSGLEVYSVDFGSTWHDEEYSYNAASLRTQLAVSGSGATAHTMLYGYDSHLRLTDEYSLTGTTQNWGRKYGFDAAGNRTSLLKHNGATTVSSTLQYNDWNQITYDSGHGKTGSEYLWDDNGAVQDEFDERDAGRDYGHDRSSRLTTVTVWTKPEGLPITSSTVSYVYDLNGRVLMKSAPDGRLEKYYYDGLSCLLIKERPAGSFTWRTKRVFAVQPNEIPRVYGERENTAWSGNTATSWVARQLHYDMFGNVVLRTDSAGQVIDRFNVDAYGNSVSGSGATSYIAGKEMDQDTGLYWFGARWYDPLIGRWLEPEPTGVDGPNLFHFVDSDPVNYTDIDGRGKGGKKIVRPTDFPPDIKRKEGESIKDFEKRCNEHRPAVQSRAAKDMWDGWIKVLARGGTMILIGTGKASPLGLILEPSTAGASAATDHGLPIGNGMGHGQKRNEPTTCTELLWHM